MLRAAEERRALTSIKVGATSPRMSHILFADDTMIFCKESVTKSKYTVRILADYDRALGQKLNMRKCSLNF
ncbi:hypothetical protein LIER_36555 [Lithospermum erythrorhizon]|uniref:Reverse transcriptase n=1 Tax=Lithospermum erythrorhizon TaxID=34254 RepID=A0AAV3PCA4_LITER